MMIDGDDDYDNEHDDEDGAKITDNKDDASSRKLLSSTAASKHGKGYRTFQLESLCHSVSS